MALTLLSFNAQSADVAVEACASATVISQSHPGVINEFAEQSVGERDRNQTKAIGVLSYVE